jgi:serine phosphatase RsbU (regulator of sigma subunit)
MNDTVDISNSNILVVDDTPANLRLLMGILRDVGYKVRPANNGLRAFSTIEKESPSLILLDIMMPDMDGYQVCEQLKASAQTRDIPVIFISALNETFDKIKAFSVGGVDYITKPFQAEEVLARVETHLKLHELQRQLQAENLRMRAELDVSRRLQQMLLPTEKELQQIDGLDIACFMEPAVEVCGDYYDVFSQDGWVFIGIGDVTGHGLESGALAIMVQSSIRTLLASIHKLDAVTFLSALNQMVYHNVIRMNVGKSLTLALLSYQNGQFVLTGQHEEVIIVRATGDIEHIDTMDLGFPIGLDFEIAKFVKQTKVLLNPSDVVVLYTDGITEAENINGLLYGLERLCEMTQKNYKKNAHEIQQAVIADVRQFIGKQKVYDDITLLVLKQQ